MAVIKFPYLLIVFILLFSFSCTSHKKEELSLDYIIRPARIQSDHPPLLVLLHGRGANEMDMYEVAKLIDERYTVLCPRGIDTLAKDSYSWFPLLKQDGLYLSDELALKEIADRIYDLIDELQPNFSYNQNNIIIGGFSQGAMLATELFYQGRFYGHIGASGAIINPPIDKKKLSGPKHSLIIHSINDELVPFENANKLEQLMLKNSVSVQLFTQRIGHSIDRESIDVINNWLKSISN